MSFLRKGTTGSSSSPASPVTAQRSRTDSKGGSSSTPSSPRSRADSSKTLSNGSVPLSTPSSPLGSTSSSSSSFSSSSSSSSSSLSGPASPSSALSSRSMTVSGGSAAPVPVVKTGGPAKMQGFLQKQNPHGITKSCKKRWFVLKDFQLSYFLSNTDTKPLGIIDLHIVERIYTKAENFGFVLSTPKREYILFASSTDERKVWMNEIKKSIYELRVAKQQAALSPAKRDQLSALKRVQVIDRSIVNTLETKGSGSSSSSPSSSSSSSPSSSPPSPSRVPALNMPSGAASLAQQVASPRTRAAATVAAANMTPVKKRPNSEELKVTFSKLETLEKDLKGLRTSREQLERAEMKLLFKSLDPSKFNAKLRGDRINYERQIDQIDSEIEALEKRISFLNEELQDGINFHFDWERLRQLSIQS